MMCKYKNRECEYAGELITCGCKEFGEPEGFHEYTYCYNDGINRDYTKCEL